MRHLAWPPRLPLQQRKRIKAGASGRPGGQARRRAVPPSWTRLLQTSRPYSTSSRSASSRSQPPAPCAPSTAHVVPLVWRQVMPPRHSILIGWTGRIQVVREVEEGAQQSSEAPRHLHKARREGAVQQSKWTTPWGPPAGCHVGFNTPTLRAWPPTRIVTRRCSGASQLPASSMAATSASSAR